MENITIVKLGGSVITQKSAVPPKVNLELVNRIAQELVSYEEKLIIVLGGGAHGHQAAQQYGFGKPDTSQKELLQGIPLIRHNMSLLSTAIEQNFNTHNLPGVVLSPFMFVTLNDGVIEDFPLHIIKTVLNSRLVPIIHGDVCIDTSKSASILSGDTIVTYLAQHLPVKAVFHGTNVDGVLESDPIVDPKAKHVSVINKSNRDAILQRTGPSSSIDVTGGMKKKINELLSLANPSVEIVIFNLLVAGRLTSLLHGNPTICTRIE